MRLQQLSFIMFIMMIMGAYALAGNKDKEEKIQMSDIFLWEQNENSNVEFLSTNFGIFGLDISKAKAGTIWPRGSEKSYIFGSGFWFGAIKKNPQGDDYKYVEVSYNPNSGVSWFAPGRIEDGDEMDESKKSKYRIYNSTKFDRASGEALNSADGENWPYWITNSDQEYIFGMDRYLGEYIYDEQDRNTGKYPLGPAFISDEDIVTSYKDTDLSRFEHGAAEMASRGYPLRLQVEESIYSWESGIYKDMVIKRYKISNRSEDTLRDCWFSKVVDSDLAIKSNFKEGAKNDHARYFIEDPSLGLVIVWTDDDQGEKDFGYMGISFLETPAVDKDGFLRQDKRVYESSEQIGIKTFRNWGISNDIGEDYARYDYMSSGVIDGDGGPADLRQLIATGHFTMLPGDETYVTVLFGFALPEITFGADGTTEDVAGIVNLTKSAKQALYNNMIMGAEVGSGFTDLSAKIYPNPAEEEVTLEFSSVIAQTADIKIIDALGNMIDNYNNYQITGGVNKIQINTSAYNSGTYYLVITDGIVKQKISFVVLK